MHCLIKEDFDEAIIGSRISTYMKGNKMSPSCYNPQQALTQFFSVQF